MNKNQRKNKNTQLLKNKNHLLTNEKSLYNQKNTYKNIVLFHYKQIMDLNLNFPYNVEVKEFIIDEEGNIEGKNNLNNILLFLLTKYTDLIIFTLSCEINLSLLNYFNNYKTFLIYKDKVFIKSIKNKLSNIKYININLLNKNLFNIRERPINRPFLIVKNKYKENNFTVLQGFLKNMFLTKEILINAKIRSTIEKIEIEGQEFNLSKISELALNLENTLKLNIKNFNNTENDISNDNNQYDSNDSDVSNISNISDYKENKGPFLRNELENYKDLNSLDKKIFDQNLIYLKNYNQFENILKKFINSNLKNKFVKIYIKENIEEENIVVLNILPLEGNLNISNYQIDNKNYFLKEKKILKESSDEDSFKLKIFDGLFYFDALAFNSLNETKKFFKVENKLKEGILTFKFPLNLINKNCFLLSVGNEPKDQNLSFVDFLSTKLFDKYLEDRVFYKEKTLIGKPIKFYKTYVVIKDMFYNKEDILYFKRYPIFNKTGEKGFIKKALGTKGLFKAYFTTKIEQGEKVKMKLYKREILP